MRVHRACINQSQSSSFSRSFVQAYLYVKNEPTRGQATNGAGVELVCVFCGTCSPAVVVQSAEKNGPLLSFGVGECGSASRSVWAVRRLSSG